MSINDPTVLKLEDDHIEDVIHEKDYVDSQAQQANELEHVMPLGMVIKTYKKAIFWSVILSTCIIMEGYDTSLIGSLYALPSFQRKYGTYFPDIDEYQVPAKWQTGISDALSVAGFFGTLSQGYLVGRFGYRAVAVSCLIYTAGTIFLFFFSTSLAMFVVAQLLFGFANGIFSTMGIAYAAEVCPTQIRGYLTEFIEICWASGELIAIGVLKGFEKYPDSEWAYRIPFGLQWVWIPPLLGFMFFIPENPWYLCRKNKLDAAEKSVMRLMAKDSGIDPKMIVANMVHVLERESEVTKNASYKQCFKGIDRRRTEIVIAAYVCQYFGGSFGSPTYFFSMAGISSKVSFDLGVSLAGVSWICTVISWGLITYIGRRPLFTYGLGLIGVVCFTIGFLAVAGQDKKAIQYAQAGMVFISVVTYRLTVGPLTTTIVGETCSMKLKSQSVSLARGSWYLVVLTVGTLSSYMVNDSAWDWKGKIGFWYGGLVTAGFIWCYFRLPECKDRTPEELDVLFVHKISARKFTKFDVDPFKVGEQVTPKIKKD